MVKTMTEDDALGAMMKGEIAQARSFIERGYEIPNHFFAETEDGRLCVFSTDWGDDAERNAMLGQVRDKFKELNVIRYCHVSEAWRSKRWDVMPSKDPKRVEILFVCGVDGESETKRMLCFPIETLPDGGRRLGDELLDQEGEFHGLGMNLLDKEPRWKN